jgi:hypothetical protein
VLYANRLLGYNLVKSKTRFFLPFLPFHDAAPLFLPLSVAALLYLPRCDATHISAAQCYARISATPLCVGSVLLLTSVSKDMPQQFE